MSKVMPVAGGLHPDDSIASCCIERVQQGDSPVIEVDHQPPGGFQWRLAPTPGLASQEHLSIFSLAALQQAGRTRLFHIRAAFEVNNRDRDRPLPSDNTPPAMPDTHHSPRCVHFERQTG